MSSEHDDGTTTTATSLTTKLSAAADEAVASIAKLQLKPVTIVKQRSNGNCNHQRSGNDDEVGVVHQHPLQLSRTNGENGLEYPEAFGLLPAYLKDMFLAAHFLRGNERLPRDRIGYEMLVDRSNYSGIYFTIT